MRSSVRLRRIAALLLCLLGPPASSHALRAQGAGAASVRGRAYAAADRAPVAYALIRLSPMGGGDAARTALTDQGGTFAFAGVAPGTYRLSLERIGYESETTEPFAVAAGQVVERTLESRPTPIALAPLVATPECRTAANLDQNPRLAALWSEARKALETSLAFADGYYYTYEQRQYWSVDVDDAPMDSLITRMVNDPRIPWRNRDHAGWGRASMFTLQLSIPDGREILDTGFLTTHCLEGDVAETADALEFGFRPVRVRRGRIDIRGVLRVDPRTLQMKEIEIEYLDEGRPFLQGTVVYQDAVVPGGIGRLPLGMTFAGRAPRAVLVRPVRGQVQYVNYAGLVKVDPAPPPAPSRN
jgi:hypothetical protein